MSRLYFTGSDVLLLNEFPKQLPRRKIFYVLLYRLFVRLSAFCVEGYDVVHEHLIPELKMLKKPVSVVPSQLNFTKKFCKIPHKGFNVLYYCPAGKDEKWNKWIYGYDIFCQVRDHYIHDIGINFIRSWGFHDMSLVYPMTDFYLRCNRHDGDARMVRECDIQNIPTYWSYQNPDFEDIIKKIEHARQCKIQKI